VYFFCVQLPVYIIAGICHGTLNWLIFQHFGCRRWIRLHTGIHRHSFASASRLSSLLSPPLIVTLGVTLSHCVCVCLPSRLYIITHRLHAALVSAAKVMRCIQCSLFLRVLLLTVADPRGPIRPWLPIQSDSLAINFEFDIIRKNAYTVIN